MTVINTYASKYRELTILVDKCTYDKLDEYYYSITDGKKHFLNNDSTLNYLENMLSYTLPDVDEFVVEFFNVVGGC